MDLGAEQRRILLDVARQTIRAALGERQTLASQVFIPNDPALFQPAGCFVTLHTAANHRLRGCVGRLDSSEPLVNVVRQSAASVLQDPRFANFRVQLSELPQLELEITAILPLVPASDCMDFDLLSEGIYLTVGGNSGCFLPQVAQETGWNKEQLLQRLCTEKLGISADAWRDPAAKMMKFKTLLIGPERF
ncbi:MAG TPA: AmmeMemoRadiSam system protein A [Tepidisphaeraceae bacterium]|nr:AmmeMemoRadiSam system protein A [Tepidisphaeraceae bacterium]